ncbi:MAG: ABC transporter permease [Armatimonadota bacterium]
MAATAAAPAPQSRPTVGKGSRAGAFYVSITMAFGGLGANKLRSFLTMLGVIIGVGAVIIAIAIGEGSRQAVAESIQKLGTNVLTVFPGSQRRGGISFGGGSSTTLKLADAEAILRGAPSVKAVSPTVNRNGTIKYANKNDSKAITGTGTDYPTISNHVVLQGRYFNAAEVRSQRRVAVVGSGVAKDIFDKASPLGKTIKINGQGFQVIGVFKEKGGTGFRNPDDAVYVPVTTAMRRLFGLESVNSLSVQARTLGLMDRARTEVEDVVRRKHRIASGAASDVTVFSQSDLAATQDAQQDTFGRLITYLAIVSLVVGGIGIMNIMLVSVTERTREIGIRKAIGARRADILTQFLLEALFLSLVGGLIGVAFGYIGSNVVSEQNGWRVTVSSSTVTLAFSFSAVVGVFFGFYPALKASNLSPIEALRYE